MYNELEEQLVEHTTVSFVAHNATGKLDISDKEGAVASLQSLEYILQDIDKKELAPLGTLDLASIKNLLLNQKFSHQVGWCY